MITIIGLGAEKGDVTKRALDALAKADRVLVRTAAHPSVQSLEEAGIPFETLDAFYERCRTYETLTRAIVREVRRAGKTGNVCYCVDGSVTEDGAARVLATGRTAVIDGVSKASAAAARAGVFGAYAAMSAYEAAERELTAPLVLYDLADRSLASDVKLTLAERFGDEADVALVAGGKVKKIKLYELDRQSGYTVDTALVLYDVPLLQKKRFVLYDLLAMLRRLRGRTHEVLTGLAVLPPAGAARTLCSRTAVTFRDFDEDELAAYLATGEPLDKAGAYGIQGHGALLIRSIAGDYYSVMGLPVAPLYEMLRGLGAV